MRRPRKPAPRDDSQAGRYSYQGLQRAIHEKARLGIMTSLASHAGGLLFGDLKELCGLTDGNLNRHLEVLREAGLVSLGKDSSAARSPTRCHLTERGRQEFAAYLAELERVVADASKSGALGAQAALGWGAV